MKFIPIFIVLLLLLCCNSTTQSEKTPSWSQCYSLPDTGIYTDIFFTNDDEGWLVGDSERIFHSADGGENWEIQNSKDYSNLLRNVHFLDNQYGWTTGYMCAYYTINGGKRWNSVEFVNYLAAYRPATSEIFFIDRENLLMFYMSGSVDNIVNRYTFDADSAKFSGTANTQFSNYFLSVTHVGNKIWFTDFIWSTKITNNIHISSDGGENWVTRKVADAVDGNISTIDDIYFFDEQKGWFCSDSSIYHSNDGGNNWHFVASLPDSNLSKIYFADDEGWVMSEQAIYYSSDSGELWQEQYRIYGDEKFVSFSFVNNFNGWALSENGNVYRYGEE